MRKKNFKMGVGKWYFTIKNGQSSIMIFRENKRDAARSYLSYKARGKDCEWNGCWNGKSFDSNEIPQAEELAA